MKNSVLPFWSWNDKLSFEEIETQIESMHRNGIDGFFMHARGGLRTEYMSQEWFDMISLGMDKADELGMQAWVYDENGWPSGSADGAVPALGLDYQQKTLQYLVWNEGDDALQAEISAGNIIAVFQKTDEGFVQMDALSAGAYVFYYKVNPHYIDVFNSDATTAFLQNTHEKYYERFKERFGTSLKGFFIDEPQFRLSPWSFVFEAKFRYKYGYELLPKLPLLFWEEDGYVTFRNDFQEMVSELFSESFLKQIYLWCEQHHCKLTGHLLNEGNLVGQMRSNNGVMPCYEYLHMPGIDHLGRKLDTPILPKQVGSVARQLGRKTITETFALCGWDVSLNELKWIAQWQYVNGVTSLCPHLEGYSLRGERKRDYPASLFTQLPWFEYAYKDFVDYFNTLGTLLDAGKDIAPLLVLHPIHSAYILHNPRNGEELQKYNEVFEQIACGLNDEHILHHYGDERIMEHYGSVTDVNGTVSLTVGQCEYGAVLLPNIINLRKETVTLLLDFAQRGGRIFATGSLPEYEDGRKTANIVYLSTFVEQCSDLDELKIKCADASHAQVYEKGQKCPAIHLTMKQLDEHEKILYFVNNSKQNHQVSIRLKGCYQVYQSDILNKADVRLSSWLESGETTVDLEFAEYGDIVLKLCEDGADYMKAVEKKEYVALDKEFHIDSCTPNALTLDKCIYQVDGGKWEPEIAVINLQNKLLELKRPCQVMLQFSFKIVEDIDFDSIELCMEAPEKFEILVNDNVYEFQDNGMYIDHAIRKSKIGSFLKVGENTIKLSCCFKQSPEVYYAKFTQGIHESVLNKLTYDTELESIYIIGNFAVAMRENYQLGDRKCIHGGKQFSLIRAKDKLDITDITHQGYWFFTGRMELSQKITVNKKEGKTYKISLKELNAPAAVLYVNGYCAGKMMFAPFEYDVTKYLHAGENNITFLMLSGNRNLLGPHHRPLGESHYVGPDTFSDRVGWTDDPKLPTWTDNYNFVLFGCELN